MMVLLRPIAPLITGPKGHIEGEKRARRQMRAAARPHVGANSRVAHQKSTTGGQRWGAWY